MIVKGFLSSTLLTLIISLLPSNSASAQTESHPFLILKKRHLKACSDVSIFGEEYNGILIYRPFYEVAHGDQEIVNVSGEKRYQIVCGNLDRKEIKKLQKEGWVIDYKKLTLEEKNKFNNFKGPKPIK
ncbi:MAG: hypothetical protein AAGF07_00435 [Patescibacteria group bacterium]